MALPIISEVGKLEPWQLGDVLRGPDDPQLRSIKADIHDERSVAEALAELTAR
jgi:hypothetical protein